MKGTTHHRILAPTNTNTGWNLGTRQRDTARTRKPGRSLPETRLQVAGRRYYSPELGRWLNRDPIGERGGKNVYVFVRNLPSLHSDPLGLEIGRNCCQRVVDKAMEANWKAQVLIAAIRADKNCEFKPPECRDCESAGGYNAGTKLIRICANKLVSNYEAETTLIHELVHAYDDCKGRLTDSCEDIVCTEIRAWDLSGDCAKGGSQYNEFEGYRDCVWRNAFSSARRATADGKSMCSEDAVLSMMPRMMAKCFGTSPTDPE